MSVSFSPAWQVFCKAPGSAAVAAASCASPGLLASTAPRRCAGVPETAAVICADWSCPAAHANFRGDVTSARCSSACSRSALQEPHGPVLASALVSRTSGLPLWRSRTFGGSMAAMVASCTTWLSVPVSCELPLRLRLHVCSLLILRLAGAALSSRLHT